MPKRIQLRRTKGWRLPAGAVSVARPSRYSNPYRIGDPDPGDFLNRPFTRESSIATFREWYVMGTYPSGWTGRLPATADRVRRELRGKDLGCWCALEEPCHVDVLLVVANGSIEYLVHANE